MSRMHEQAGFIQARKIFCLQPEISVFTDGELGESLFALADLNGYGRYEKGGADYRR